LQDPKGHDRDELAIGEGQVMCEGVEDAAHGGKTLSMPTEGDKRLGQ